MPVSRYEADLYGHRSDTKPTCMARNPLMRLPRTRLADVRRIQEQTAARYLTTLVRPTTTRRSSSSLEKARQAEFTAKVKAYNEAMHKPPPGVFLVVNQSDVTSALRSAASGL
ncbi:MAG: hypothetical protein KVP17_001870 [Porospora cf. gigantea B]|uniref:uncharacterized protein n=1 Tax=Porospora cf. gigantea B TaxID=2853592 RepID=UPI003571EDE6|nr:MAG: hypothetical protein KVP17_001870 [Porospora cf. gigantea B]